MKKLLALLLTLSMLLTGFAMAEATDEAATEEVVPFVFRDAITWESTSDEIAEAFAEFGVMKMESGMEGLVTIAFEEYVPFNDVNTELAIMLWQDKPVMIEHMCWNSVMEGETYEDFEAVLKAEYGESSEEAVADMEALMMLMGSSEAMFTEYAKCSAWRVGDALVSMFLTVEDDPYFYIVYTNEAGIQAMIEAIVALYEAVDVSE